MMLLPYLARCGNRTHASTAHSVALRLRVGSLLLDLVASLKAGAEITAQFSLLN